MKRFIFFLPLFVLLSSCAPVNEVSTPKPSIYVIRIDHVLTFEGKEVWVLEYTVDGVLQTPVFDSLEVVAEYLEYLGTIGKVYRKEDASKLEIGRRFGVNRTTVDTFMKARGIK
jgi:hypothetical protein